MIVSYFIWIIKIQDSIKKKKVVKLFGMLIIIENVCLEFKKDIYSRLIDFYLS